MNIVQIDNWQDYRRDGEQFLATATGAWEKKAKAFSPETLYNLVCMGIEKLIMAFLMKNGDLAENHTMGDLLRALELHMGHQSQVSQDLNWLDSFQEICDLENWVRKAPSTEDVEHMLAIGQRIHALLGPHIMTEERI